MLQVNEIFKNAVEQDAEHLRQESFWGKIFLRVSKVLHFMLPRTILLISVSAELWQPVYKSKWKQQPFLSKVKK